MTRHGLTVLALVLTIVASASAANIRGEYLEARSCDVYTGPCFANGQMGLAGKEALIAWKVDTGSWEDVDLTGLSVALVLCAEGTLGDDGVFGMDAGRIRSLILVDQKATPDQHKALVAFAKDSARQLTQNVVGVITAPMSLENDHLSGKGRFRAGTLARIDTRAIEKGDCVCSNEIVYYQPLTKVKDFSPAFTQTATFKGPQLKNTWTDRDVRSAFLATFRR